MLNIYNIIFSVEAEKHLFFLCFYNEKRPFSTQKLYSDIFLCFNYNTIKPRSELYLLQIDGTNSGSNSPFEPTVQYR